MSRTIEATPLSAPAADADDGADDENPAADTVQADRDEGDNADEAVVNAEPGGLANNFPFPIDHAAFCEVDAGVCEAATNGNPFGMDGSTAAAAAWHSVARAACTVGTTGGENAGVKDTDAGLFITAELDASGGTGSVATTSAAATLLTAGPRRCASQKDRCAASSAATPG